MAEIDSKNCKGDEVVSDGDNNQELQVGNVSPTNSILKRKLSSKEDEINLQIKEEENNEYADNSKRNKSDDSEHNKKIKTEKCEIDVEEQNEEAGAEINGIVPKPTSDATDNFTASTDMKSVGTVKEEVTDTSFLKDIKQEPCDDDNVASFEEYPAGASAVSTNGEVSNNAATAVQPEIQPEVKVEVNANEAGISRPSCRFGVKCYRVNALHRQQEAHPCDQDYRRPDYPQPPPGAPMCPFMEACYRRNPVHFQQYAHPSGYNSQLVVPPVLPQLHQPQLFRIIDNLAGFEVAFEGFSDSGSEYEPSDHEETSDEGVDSDMGD